MANGVTVFASASLAMAGLANCMGGGGGGRDDPRSDQSVFKVCSDAVYDAVAATQPGGVMGREIASVHQAQIERSSDGNEVNIVSYIDIPNKDGVVIRSDWSCTATWTGKKYEASEIKLMPR